MRLMDSKSCVLVTNDDGIDHPGLHALAIEIEQSGRDVTVVAPDFNASGLSAALGTITAGLPIALKQHKIEGFNGRAFGLNAPPATCVLIAQLGAFGADFKVVVSGINDGFNTGRSVLHSGTVGAALAAQNFGMRGLAVSTSRTEPILWQTAARFAVSILSSLELASPRCTVNLNVPSLPVHEIKGIRWGVLAPYNNIRSTIGEQTDQQIVLKMVPPPSPPQADTDLGLALDGYAAVTSLHAGSEVWSDRVQPNDVFDIDLPIPAVTAGDELRPARSYLI